MSHIPPSLKEHVGALCAKLPDAIEPTYQGSCFFVEATSSTGLVFDYVVTAKHVWQALKNAGGGAYLRVNRGYVGQFNQGVIDEPIPLEGWLFHHDAHVDLAVLPLAFIGASKVGNEDVVFRLLKMKINGLLQARPQDMPWPPLEGEEILFIAMTSQFHGRTANLPTVRRGGIALVTDEPLEGKYGLSQYYVIESQVYPGNSGSPVWFFYQGGLVSLGVLVFAYPTEQEIRKQIQGGTNIYYNFGLSLVVPIEKVVEIVNSRKEVERRETQEGLHLPGVAHSTGEEIDESFMRVGFDEASQ